MTRTDELANFRARLRAAQSEQDEAIDGAVEGLLEDLRCPACGAISADHHGHNVGHFDEWWDCYRAPYGLRKVNDDDE
jgi:hypothetical protein